MSAPLVTMWAPLINHTEMRKVSREGILQTANKQHLHKIVNTIANEQSSKVGAYHTILLL